MSTGTKQAIYNDGGRLEISGTAYLSNTSISRPAVHNKKAAGVINITGGTIVSTRFAAIQNEAGTLNIGTNDGVVDATTPVIKSDTYAIKIGSKINFYDGILKGKSGITEATSLFQNTESGYTLHYSNTGLL